MSSIVIGVPMPGDFPSDAFDRVHVLLQETFYLDRTFHQLHAPSWGSVARRFYDLAFADDEFRREFSSQTATFESRAVQERDLLLFFVCGVATIESFCFSSHLLLSELRPDIASRNEKTLRNVSLTNTLQLFESNYPDASFTLSLQRVQDGDDSRFGMRNLARLRNTIAHRGSPPRQHYLGGPKDGQVAWFDHPLSPDLLQEWRLWIRDALEDLLCAKEDFILQYGRSRDKETRA